MEMCFYASVPLRERVLTTNFLSQRHELSRFDAVHCAHRNPARYICNASIAKNQHYFKNRCVTRLCRGSSGPWTWGSKWERRHWFGLSADHERLRRNALATDMLTSSAITAPGL